MSSTSFWPNFSSPFVNKMALSTNRVHYAASSRLFNVTWTIKEVWLTFSRITSFPSPGRYLLPNERTCFGKEKETLQMPQENSLQPKKLHYLKTASSVFRIRNHCKGFVVVSFSPCWLEDSRWKPKAVLGRCRIGQKLIPPNTLRGSHKEAAKHALDKMVVIQEPLNRKRTQATTCQHAQLNFTKLFEVTVRKRCSNQMLLFISP